MTKKEKEAAILLGIIFLAGLCIFGIAFVCHIIFHT